MNDDVVRHALELICLPGEPRWADSGLYVLPWPPSINHYREPAYRRGGGLRLRLSKAATDYRYLAVSAITGERVRQARPWRSIRGPVAMVVEYHPGRAGVDIDNYAKGVFDALEHARVFHDDRQVKRVISIMHEPAKTAANVRALVVPISERGTP